MQSWRRQSNQCFFCVFRQAEHARRRTPRARDFSDSAVRGQDTLTWKRDKYKTVADSGIARGRKPFLVKDGFKRLDGERPYERPSRKQTTLDKQYSRARRSDRPVTGSDAFYKGLEDGIKTSLDNLERLFISTKSDDQSSKTQMQILDPNGKLWPAYRAWMQSLRKRTTATHSSSATTDIKLWTMLNSIWTRNRAGLQKELQFGFFDFALKPIDTNELREFSNLPIDLRYPTEWYANARKSQRVIHLHIGPTNSGKTYNALKRLQESGNGFYAGPLRLLAHEVYSRFRAKGIKCDLITGDDVRLEGPDTHVYASTVEMVNTGREVEVAVIDEIQMMGSEDRGWAWTRAFLGANAKEVHLCGEERVLPLVRELSASMGDSLRIHRYQRLNPLRVMSRSFRGNLKNLRKGDCIVAFSIVQLHALRAQIESETGKRCAIVYGSLPPETRAEQADLFNDPDNDYDYLVASDAIGMGLNLSIKRIIFNSVHKFDGMKEVRLTIPQIKQIAGRAGRYRSAHQDKHDIATSPQQPSSTGPQEETAGLVTCLDEADLPIIRSALETEAPPLKQAGILPPAEYLEEYSTHLPPLAPFEYLLRKVCHAATIHPRFFLCDVRDKLKLARITDEVPGLTIEERVTICAAPLSGRDPKLAACLKAFATAIANNTPLTVAEARKIPLEIIPDDPKPDKAYLESLETLHKCLILFLWLSYRFPHVLRDQPMAIHAKGLTEQKINWTLRAFSANPKLRERLNMLQKESYQKKVEADAAAAVTTAVMNEKKIDVDTEADSRSSGPNAAEEQHPEQQEQLRPMNGEEETLQEHFAEPVLSFEQAQSDASSGGEGLQENPPEEALSPSEQQDNTTEYAQPDRVLEKTIRKQLEALKSEKPGTMLDEDIFTISETTSDLDATGHERGLGDLPGKAKVPVEQRDEMAERPPPDTDEEGITEPRAAAGGSG